MIHKRNARQREAARFRRALKVVVALAKVGAKLNEIRAQHYTPPTFERWGVTVSTAGEPIIPAKLLNP